MTTKRERMYARIEQHGQNLLAIFPNAMERDPVKLCKKLRKLDLEAAQHTVAMCNGEGCDTIHEETLTIIENKIAKLLANDPSTGVPVFINRDPRGYALKIDDEWLTASMGRDKFYDTPARRLHRDFGGYGIIAPDLTEE